MLIHDPEMEYSIKRYAKSRNGPVNETIFILQSENVAVTPETKSRKHKKQAKKAKKASSQNHDGDHDDDAERRAELARRELGGGGRTDRVGRQIAAFDRQFGMHAEPRQ